MNKTIKLICLTVITLLTFSTVSFGQVYKLKSTAYTYMYKINDYSWSGWDEWKETTVLITIDLNKQRITIYSQEMQVYDVAENEGEHYDSDGDETLSLYCVDKNGITCRIRLVKLISQGGRNQLYVDYSDMKWVYNVYFLD